MLFVKKISMLVMVASLFCGEGVFARSHHSRDQEVNRSAKKLQKARSEHRKAERNVVKKRQQRIRAENKFNRAVGKRQRSCPVRGRCFLPPIPQDGWVRMDHPNGMTEITRIRYGQLISRGGTTLLPYPQKPVIVPTIIADVTLFTLKASAAQEPMLSPVVVIKENRRRSFF